MHGMDIFVGSKVTWYYLQASNTRNAESISQKLKG